VGAVGWSLGLKAGFQLVTWAATLFVIRILTPDDYGLMAITQVFVNMMGGLSAVGLTDALIQRGSTPRSLVASAFGWVLLTSCLLAVLLCASAYPVAAWFADPRLVPLLQAGSLGFLLNGLSAIPRVFLTKALRVRPVALVESLSGLVTTIAVITLAYAGFGVWALMLGWLLGSVARLGGLAILGAEHYVRPSLDFRLLQPLFSFSVFRTSGHLLWLAFTSADVLVAGRLLGPSELGLYMVALNFAAMPLAKVAPAINAVAFPAFASLQSNPSMADAYALKAMRLMATVSVAVFFGVSAIAPEVVAVAFGAKWAAAAPLLAILSLAMTFRAVLLVIPSYLQGLGHARAGFWCTAAGALIFPPAFVLGCRWGAEGLCCAWLLGYPVMFVANAVTASRQARLPAGALLAAPLRPALAGGMMVLAVTMARPWLQGPEAVRITLLIAVGVAAYAAAMVLAFRPLTMEILSIFDPRRTKAL